MAVRLRLKRMGRTNVNFFRVCAFDGRTRRDGRAIEYLGWYDPRVAEDEKKCALDRDRISYWLSVGAKPSETVQSILLKSGIQVPGVKKQQAPTPEEKAAKQKEREAKKQKRAEALARKAAHSAAQTKEGKKEKREAKKAGG